MAPKRKTTLETWGNELARARDAVGMSGAKLAEAINVVPSTISQWENGKRNPRLRDVERAEKVLGTNGYLKRFLQEWLPREISPEWHQWEEVEAEADTILWFEHSIIPGLLQTEEYARAVLSHDRYSPIDLDERVRARLERQAILDAEVPPTTVFAIGEYALHNQVGTRETMYEQLIHLIELAQRPHVIIQVVPLDAGFHRGHTGAFIIAKVHGREVAFQDGIWSGQVLENDVSVSTLANTWQHILSKALTSEASIELLRREAEKWKP